jgi:hypothetical protein
MADRETSERAARRIIEELTREFPGVEAELDFETEREEHEDAFLWISAGAKDEEEIKEIWGYAIKLVQDAYANEDVYLVARMKGAGVIDRDRPPDQDF